MLLGRPVQSVLLVKMVHLDLLERMEHQELKEPLVRQVNRVR